jgi:hypothetical protein
MLVATDEPNSLPGLGALVTLLRVHGGPDPASLCRYPHRVAEMLRCAKDFGLKACAARASVASPGPSSPRPATMTRAEFKVVC